MTLHGVHFFEYDIWHVTYVTWAEEGLHWVGDSRHPDFVIKGDRNAAGIVSIFAATSDAIFTARRECSIKLHYRKEESTFSTEGHLEFWIGAISRNNDTMRTQLT